MAGGSLATPVARGPSAAVQLKHRHQSPHGAIRCRDGLARLANLQIPQRQSSAEVLADPGLAVSAEARPGAETWPRLRGGRRSTFSRRLELIEINAAPQPADHGPGRTEDELRAREERFVDGHHSDIRRLAIGKKFTHSRAARWAILRMAHPSGPAVSVVLAPFARSVPRSSHASLPGTAQGPATSADYSSI